MEQKFIPFRTAAGAQPRLLDTVVQRVERALVASDTARRRPARPVFLGIGASYAAVAAPVAVLRSDGVGALRALPADYDRLAFAGADLVVAASQSGRSRETVEAVGRVDAPTMALVNIADSPLTEHAGETIDLGSVPDSFASTIGYTATVAALGMITDTWTTGSPGPRWADLGARVAQFQHSVGDLASAIADEWESARCIDMVAAAGHLGTAEAASLLIREVVRVPTAAYETRQYLHGPIEATEGVGHIVFGTPDADRVTELLSRDGRQVTLVVGESEPAPAQRPGIRVCVVPGADAIERSIFAAVLLQHVADVMSARRGVDPDEFFLLSDDIKIDGSTSASSLPGQRSIGADRE